MSIFTGAATAIITPFHNDADQSINYEAMADFVDYQIDHGIDALVVAGSTGEAATMTEAEHLQISRFVVEHTKGRVPVIAGTGSNCTRTAVELTRETAHFGADAVLVITPYYNKATQEGLYGHFKAVADAAAGVPVIMYNVPSRTGCNLLPATVARLVKDIDNIKGVKEACGDISQIVKLMALTDGNIELYSGNDDQVVPLLSMGGLGVISVVSNVMPGTMHDMCAKFFAGDIRGAAALQMKIQDIFECLFSEVNPIPVKKAVALMGFEAGPLRMPLTEMSSDKAARMEKVMKDLGILKA